MTVQILIVEDSPTQAAYLAFILQEQGYAILQAADGLEGLTLTQSQRPDLVISDIHMPGMHGFEMCLAIKSNPDLSAIPIILLTSLTESDSLFRGLQARADYYITKPVAPETLLRTIRHALTTPRSPSNQNSVMAEVTYDNQSYQIPAQPQRIINLLMATYENATRQNEELLQAQRALQALNEQLEFLVRKRTQELEQIAFISAHDLREPVRITVSYAQLLARRYQDELDDNARTYIQFLVEGAHRMDSLLQDVLAYLELDKQAVGNELVEATASLAAVIAQYAEPLRSVGGHITYDSLPRIWTNASQLDQLWSQLLDNSLKFRSQAAPQVHISVQHGGDHWLFAVQDNGMGVESAYYEQIFTFFKRLNPRDQYPGNGAGLAICRKIVERHRGRIWLESTPGAGSTVFFTWPTAEERERNILT